MTSVHQAESTRSKILETALDLFHKRTYNGTSINEIVEKAGITKGALFHYFKGKVDLGYAVIDGPLRRMMNEVWVKPLETSVDPVGDILAIIENLSQDCVTDPEIAAYGCPLNNMAQELSSQDEGFREKLEVVYDDWHRAIEKSIRAGIDAGTVRADANPQAVSATIVALCEGCIGTMKVFQDSKHLVRLGIGFSLFLECLRPN